MFLILFNLYYIIADMIVIRLYLDTFFPKKKCSRPAALWAILLIYELLSTFFSGYFFGTYTMIKSIVLISLCFFMMLALTLLFEASFRYRLFISIFYILFSTICEDIPGTLLQIISDKVMHLEMEQIELLVQAQYALCFLLLLSPIRIFFRRKNRHYILQYSIAILITPVLSLFVIGDATQTMTLNTASKISYVIKAVCLFVINIINFVLLDNYFTIQNLETEKESLTQQISYQSSKYNQISIAYRNTRSILHDTKKHFLYLQQCIQKNDTSRGIPYMEHALKEMESVYSKINTGNLVIDSFLTNHLTIAEREGILYTTDINVNPNLVPVEDYDLSIILGNLLDNTLEECRSIKQPADRSIYVQIITTEVAFSIHIVNSSQGDKRKDRMHDTDYTLYHGYGLENVRVMTRKYYGSYDFLQKEKYFDVAIRIPVIKDRMPKRVGDAY